MSQPLLKRANPLHKILSFAVALSLLGPFSVAAQQMEFAFPQAPHSDLTPGDLCDKPDSFRYPERIPYCERRVDSKTKYEIIEDYEERYGYRILATGRANFKIDHMIPLCMGGSNDDENLWPQHKSVYELTDPLEPELCSRMSSGRMTQAEAVDIIRSAKADPRKAPEIYRKLTGRSQNGRR